MSANLSRKVGTVTWLGNCQATTSGGQLTPTNCSQVTSINIIISGQHPVAGENRFTSEDIANFMSKYRTLRLRTTYCLWFVVMSLDVSNLACKYNDYTVFYQLLCNWKLYLNKGVKMLH